MSPSSHKSLVSHETEWPDNKELFFVWFGNVWLTCMQGQTRSKLYASLNGIGQRIEDKLGCIQNRRLTRVCIDAKKLTLELISNVPPLNRKQGRMQHFLCRVRALHLSPSAENTVKGQFIWEWAGLHLLHLISAKVKCNGQSCACPRVWNCICDAHQQL